MDKTNQGELNNQEIKSILASQDVGEHLFPKALDAANVGVVITDNRLPDNPIIYCNSAFQKLSGYSRAEIMGRNCRFLQREDRNQEERHRIAEAIREGKHLVTEIRNYNKDGMLFYNELYLSPVKNETGVVTHFIGIQNDVTRRRQVELDLQFQRQEAEERLEQRTLALRESEEYMQSIVQTIRESLVVLDKDYNVLSVNNFFLNTFKVTINETKGFNLYELGNGQWNIPHLRRLMEEILPSNNPVLNYEVDHEFPHIGRKLMLLNAHRVELEGEYKDRILLAIEDITERRSIEQRKDDFLTIASHELRTPLTTIQGYTQILSRSLPAGSPERVRSLVGKLSGAVDRLNQLLSELLDMSKIQSGYIQLHKDRVPFDELVAGVAESMQTASPGHNIILEGSSDADVYADESHLVQVISNLIGNAIKYAPDEQRIEIRISRVGDFVKLSVKDYGLGISPADQKHIFERFFRVDKIQKDFPGMGIGLYICEQVIKNHGGTLWVESDLGKGSIFSFTLPVYAEGKEAGHE
ncbi:ATP-binding protein [Pedobacter yulinensis]|uniref:ATP-binding protein n=1 Tax=Pedobacter yulinensis TaxID=2126353 RepID=UPI001EF7DB24|nr:ATP-binding protein [Pedobacter yulinensis]